MNEEDNKKVKPKQKTTRNNPNEKSPKDKKPKPEKKQDDKNKVRNNQPKVENKPKVEKTKVEEKTTPEKVVPETKSEPPKEEKVKTKTEKDSANKEDTKKQEEDNASNEKLTKEQSTIENKEEPTNEKQEPVKEQPAKVKKKKEKKVKEPKEKKKLSKKLFLIPIIALVIIILILAIYIFILPLKAKVDTNGDSVTKTGYLDFDINIKANKPILNIYYSFDPADENDLTYYTEYKDTEGLFSTNMELDDISIPVGKRELTIYVKSLFGKHDIVTIPVEFKLGYINDFDIDNVGTVDGVQAVKDELIVTFNDKVKSNDAKKLLESYEGKIVGEIYFMNQYQVQFEGNIKSIKRELEAESDVKNVSYNTTTDINFTTENGTTGETSNMCNPSGNLGVPDVIDRISKNYHATKIHAQEAYDLVTNPTVINVGIMESPIFYKHDDLNIDKKNIFVPNYGDVSNIDELLEMIDTATLNQTSEVGCDNLAIKAHGTHVAGIIAALHNNNEVSGITDRVNLYYASPTFYSIKDGKINQKVTSFSVGYALSYLVMSDVKVINMSFGKGTYTDSEYQSYKAYFDTLFDMFEKSKKDFLMVKAAGNDNADASNELYNKIFKENDFAKDRTIIVGASATPIEITADDIATSPNLLPNIILDNKSAYSNYGETVDIYAPGAVYSTIYENGYQWAAGTSMAAPQVTGTAALLYTLNPNFSASTIKEIIKTAGEYRLSFNNIMRNVLDAEAAVKLAKEKMKDKNYEVEEKDSEYGLIQGSIQDAITGKMPNVFAGNITFTDVNDSSKVYVGGYGTAGKEVAEGNYEFILPVGTYNMHIDFEGYIDETVYNIEVTDKVITYNILLKVVNSTQTTNGKAIGKIINAFNGDSIPNANIKFYRGIANTTGDVVAEVNSDSSGKYEVELAPGNYTAYTTAEGYTPSKTNILVISEKDNNQDCTITPILKEGEIRAILTWGEYPRDLDSHLVGPTPDGGRFHTYFEKKNYYYNNTKYDNLDLDDITSYGPETTSVYVGVDGTYTYYVHDYSNRGSSNSKSLGLSGAQVKLYIAGKEEPIVYNVPNQSGTLWKVFTIENGEVKPINEMSYHNNPSTIGN